MKIESSIVIHRPVEIVFAYVSDPCNLPRWGSEKAVQVTSQGPVGLGTTFQRVSALLGMKLEDTMEITAYEANRQFTAKNISGPFPGEASFYVEPAEGGTRLTCTLQAEPGGFFKLTEGFLLSQARKLVDNNFQRLKQLLEAEPG
jgi:ligand-binding SRPBCC domain-containing protein